MTDLNSLAALVQRHVPEQPWSSYGHEPIPVQIWFSQDREEPWTVEFVLGLNSTGSRRRKGFASGTTVEEALQKARRMQMADAARLREKEGTP